MTQVGVTDVDMARAKDWYWVIYSNEDSNPMRDADKAVKELAEDFAAHSIAARNAALEEAAKVADETDTGWFDQRTFTAQKIAATIRALMTKEPK